MDCKIHDLIHKIIKLEEKRMRNSKKLHKSISDLVLRIEELSRETMTIDSGDVTKGGNDGCIDKETCSMVADELSGGVGDITSDT